MTKDLFLAILSMDAYNRGYNAGIDGLSDEIGTQIGDATISNRTSSLPNSPEVDASFYAVAYEWDGQTIISYRGTDSPLFELPLVDYPISANDDFDEAQVHLASQFFQSVADEVDSDTITLTGHSLGGALAGFVGSLYGQESTAFAPIDFFPAVQNFRLLLERYLAVKDTPEANTDMIALPNMGTFNTVPFAEAQLTAMDISLNDIPAISAQLTNYTSFHLSGEIAESARSVATPSTTILENLLPFMGGIDGVVGAIDAHSISLTAIGKYAEQQYVANGVSELNFIPIIEPLFQALFDNEIADAAGTTSLEGDSPEHAKMRDAIAYSALDEGTLIFGNTGIRAFFDDANELGEQVLNGMLPTGHADSIPGLAEAIAQFAGQMALNKVNYTDHSNWKPEEGFLSTYESNGRDYLKADLRKELWNLGGSDPEKTLNIKGIQTILDSFLAEEGEAGNIQAAMQLLYGSQTTNIIDRIDFALGDQALTVELEEHDPNTSPYKANAASLFLGVDQVNKADGNSDNNIIVGGAAKDTLYGREGKDIIVGGAENDQIVDLVTEKSDDGRLNVSNEDDVYIGGSGDDTVEYRLVDERDSSATLPAQGLSITGLDSHVTMGNSDAIKLEITDLNSGNKGEDHLVDIEKIVLSKKRDEVDIQENWLDADLEIDMSQAGGGSDATFTKADYDFVSFAGLGHGVEVKEGKVSGSGLTISGAEDVMLTSHDDAYITQQELGKIDGGDGDDVLIAYGPEYIGQGELVHPSASDSPKAGDELILELHGGIGNDRLVTIGGEGTQLFGGIGEDLLFSMTRGAELSGGKGTDIFYFSHDTLITDATPDEKIVAFDGSYTLTGGTRGSASEDPWAYGRNGFRFALNDDGELVIENQMTARQGFGATYVANAEVSPFVAFSERTAGLLVFEFEVEVHQGWEGWSGGLFDFFELTFGYQLKAMNGESHFSGVDPLVLDLDGDGLELTARTTQSPLFDLDGDGVGDDTSWIGSGDAFLFLDRDGDGNVMDDIGGMIGGLFGGKS